MALLTRLLSRWADSLLRARCDRLEAKVLREASTIVSITAKLHRVEKKAEYYRNLYEVERAKRTHREGAA